jgi:hypothetical protein
MEVQYNKRRSFVGKDYTPLTITDLRIITFHANFNDFIWYKSIKKRSFQQILIMKLP